MKDSNINLKDIKIIDLISEGQNVENTS